MRLWLLGGKGLEAPRVSVSETGDKDGGADITRSVLDALVGVRNQVDEQSGTPESHQKLRIINV